MKKYEFLMLPEIIQAAHDTDLRELYKNSEGAIWMNNADYIGLYLNRDKKEFYIGPTVTKDVIERQEKTTTTDVKLSEFLLPIGEFHIFDLGRTSVFELLTQAIGTYSVLDI